MATLLDTITSYVPTMIVRRWLASAGAQDAPEAEKVTSAVLFADISGFTTLAERLAQSGPTGAEELIRILNAFFGQLIELVYDHGGDVVNFAGDSLLALWPASEALEDLETLTLRAAQCGLAMRATLDKRSTREGASLSLRVGIGTGEVTIAHVGGVSGRWIPLVTGVPLIELGAISHQAEPGEVVLTTHAYARIQENVAAEPLRKGGVRLVDLLATIPTRTTPCLTPPPDAMLHANLPSCVLSRLMAGQTDWLAELRPITVLFVNLPDLAHDTPLAHAQGVTQALQTVLNHYEGSINKLSVDEKGVSLVAAMGLPPLAHEDDPLRGVQAALAIHHALDALGVRSSTGVSTGRVFCGEVGNARRREYTMIGDTVNLAARLMQAAEGGILCDLATFHATSSRMVFETLPTITAKGKTGPLGVFRPLGEATRIGPVTTPMIGRLKERQKLGTQLKNLVDGTTSGVLLIEGEAGIGKTRLITTMLEPCEDLGVTVLRGWADPIEKTIPYRAWRPVFQRLFKLEAVADEPEACQAEVLSRLQAEPDLLPLAPLLNAVLTLELPETEQTAKMTGKVRLDNTHSLLASILQREASSKPLLLILEDVHWLDSASWALTLLVSQLVCPMLLVLATRPLSDPLPVEYLHILASLDTEEIRLEALPLEDTLTLVKQRFGVRTLPNPVADLIRDKAEGHPFFSEELANVLLESGLITIEGEECGLAEGATDLRTLNLPNTVEGVITSRIDRLTPPQQLTLKVASVVGRSFSVRTLHDVYPLEIELAELNAHLQTLERLDLTPLASSTPEPIYHFKHVITQEVVYNLMLFAQRQQLHRSVAEWYERTFADDLSAHLELLAFHWIRAEVMPKACAYLEKAGERALDSGRYAEATRCFSELLALDEQAGATHHRRQESKRLRQLGRAYLGIGQLDKSRLSLERALERLGSPLPTERPLSVFPYLVGAVLKHVAHPLCIERPSSRGHERELGLETARILEALVEIYSDANEATSAMVASLMALDALDGLGATPERARAYANLAVAAGSAKLHALARRYGAHAQAIAAIARDPSTEAYVLTRCNRYVVGTGAWTERVAEIESAIQGCRTLADPRAWAECVAEYQAILGFEGRFEEGLEQCRQLVQASKQHGDIRQQHRGLCGMAGMLFRLGRVDEAVALMEGALDQVLEGAQRIEAVNHAGRLAEAYLRGGKYVEAWQRARLALELISAASPASFHALDGYAATVEVLLSLRTLPDLPDAIERKQLEQAARLALQRLRRFARTFRVAAASYDLLEGLSRWQRGQPSRARRSWKRAIREARARRMPFVEARALTLLGRHLSRDDARRAAILLEATAIFARLETPYEYAHARSSQET